MPDHEAQMHPSLDLGGCTGSQFAAPKLVQNQMQVAAPWGDGRGTSKATEEPADAWCLKRSAGPWMETSRRPFGRPIGQGSAREKVKCLHIGASVVIFWARPTRDSYHATSVVLLMHARCVVTPRRRRLRHPVTSRANADEAKCVERRKL